MAVQIALMDRIYSCAQLTIVNDMPGANEGIPGVGPARQFTPTVYKCKSQEWTNVRLGINEAMADSPGETRGWTFQEKICSKRLLIMTLSQAFFHCQHATWFEDTIIEDTEEEFTQFKPFKADYIIHKDNGSLDLGFLSKKYEGLVKEYSKRIHTDEQDVLNAFTGALNSLDCGHTWGLPDPVFHDALCWNWKIHNDLKFAGLAFGNTPEFCPIFFKIHQSLIDQNSTEAMEDTQIHGDVEGRWDYQYLPPQAEGGLKMEPFRYFADCIPPMPPVSHILRFWTMVLHLHVDRIPYKSADPSLTRKDEFMVRRKSGEAISTVYLEPEWRRSQPDALEFITLCSRVPVSAVPSRMLLIERDKNNIAYRVQLLHWIGMNGPKNPGTYFPSKDEEIKWKIITLA